MTEHTTAMSTTTAITTLDEETREMRRAPRDVQQAGDTLIAAGARDVWAMGGADDQHCLWFTDRFGDEQRVDTPADAPTWASREERTRSHAHAIYAGATGWAMSAEALRDRVALEDARWLAIGRVYDALRAGRTLTVTLDDEACPVVDVDPRDLLVERRDGRRLWLDLTPRVIAEIMGRR